MQPVSAIDQLKERVGADAVRTDASALSEVNADLTENPEGHADAVVCISDLEQLQAAVRLASEQKIPLTPRVAGTNLGGLTLPVRGGWVLDLRPMNRIVSLDADNLVAVLEPGVTFAQLKAAMDTCQPRLTLGYPLAPPDASVMANCLLDGLGNLSLRHGAMGDWINGLEVVRADGSLLRTGVGALGVAVPFARAPLPDLTGLFLSWQGTTGIVSKLAVQLWPAPAFRERAFVLAYDRAATLRALRELPRLDVLDDLGGLSWPTGKLLFGVHHPKERDPAEPEFFFYLDIGASGQQLLDEKWRIVHRYLGQLRSEGLRIENPLDLPTLLRIEPRFERLVTYPTRLDFLLDHPDGGLTWVGTYGPMSRFERGIELGVGIVERHGFPPTIVARPMRGGHFGVLRFIQVFRRHDPADCRRVQACNAELGEALLEEGFVMYKTPGWILPHYQQRLDSGFARLVREIRSLVDPHGILNPGRWELRQP
jgi:FAD/FMN-containing dehydrogenase